MLNVIIIFTCRIPNYTMGNETHYFPLKADL